MAICRSLKCHFTNFFTNFCKTNGNFLSSALLVKMNIMHIFAFISNCPLGNKVSFKKEKKSCLWKNTKNTTWSFIRPFQFAFLPLKMCIYLTCFLPSIHRLITSSKFYFCLKVKQSVYWCKKWTLFPIFRLHPKKPSNLIETPLSK